MTVASVHVPSFPREELVYFVTESNSIEGIRREPTWEEITATEDFIRFGAISAEEVSWLVHIYQPDAELRDRPGLNVRVGNHIAPPGGPAIANALIALLDGLTDKDPWVTHVAYETLHPFTDGNGRSGRAIWAWQMVRRQGGLPLGFLHQWYYQTLERSGRVPAPTEAPTG